MTREPDTLAAAFFLPRDRDSGSVSMTHLAAAGITAIDTTVDGSQELSERPIAVRWAGFTCTANLEAATSFHLVTIRFRRADFLALLPEDDRPAPVEADGALPVAVAFRDTCVALGPDAAVIATHADQATPAFIRSLELSVLSRDADGLADLRLGLLYLAERLAAYVTANPVRGDRDTLPVSSGRLLFAGRGWARWF